MLVISSFEYHATSSILQQHRDGRSSTIAFDRLERHGFGHGVLAERSSSHDNISGLFLIPCCRKQRGGSVKLTGALNVPHVALNWCFESSIDVCAS
jgi:hypothetical protein